MLEVQGTQCGECLQIERYIYSRGHEEVITALLHYKFTSGTFSRELFLASWFRCGDTQVLKLETFRQ